MQASQPLVPPRQNVALRENLLARTCAPPDDVGQRAKVHQPLKAWKAVDVRLRLRLERSWCSTRASAASLPRKTSCSTRRHYVHGSASDLRSRGDVPLFEPLMHIHRLQKRIEPFLVNRDLFRRMHPHIVAATSKTARPHPGAMRASFPGVGRLDILRSRRSESRAIQLSSSATHVTACGGSPGAGIYARKHSRRRWASGRPAPLLPSTAQTRSDQPTTYMRSAAKPARSVVNLGPANSLAMVDALA